MKKVAVTVAVLALGLAACKPSGEANNAAEANVETNAAVDTNVATNDATATVNADNALNSTDTGAANGAAANTTNQ